MTNLPADRKEAATGRSQTRKSGKKHTYLILFGIWLTLVAGGLWGAKLYTDYLRMQIASEIAAQTEAKLAEVQKDYMKEVTALKESVEADMTVMQEKLNTMNELLAFTKDSANSKTDNSNQLYTQLADVKNKLEELKKNLDILK